MSLTTQFAAANDATFQNLIQAAIVQQAIAISNESGGTADHTNRVILANKILLGSSGYVSIFAQAVASQGVDKTATDTVILTTIAAVWNTISG